MAKKKNPGFLNKKQSQTNTVKPVLNGHSKRTPKLVFNTNYDLMQVKSIAECILQYFRPSLKLPFTIKTFVLPIFKWPLKKGFTVETLI